MTRRLDALEQLAVEVQGGNVYVDLAFMVRADPVEHLGARSLERWDAFQVRYHFFHPAKALDFHVEPLVREWVIRLYKPAFDVSSLNASGILRWVIADEERAFDLYFTHVEAVLAAHPAVFLKPTKIERDDLVPPPPVSALLQLRVLSERPRMYLARLSPGCLRAFLDGYRLACLDAGHFECADLDGFEHWVRKELNQRGLFRWEKAILAHFGGREEDAFDWTLKHLEAFRDSLGPLSEVTFETHGIR